MFSGIKRRIISVWFPRLASERVLRSCPIEGPFVLTIREKNANQIYCLNEAAEQQGLYRGMSYSDARAFCPGLQSAPAHLPADQYFLTILRRWATGYCPWVGLEGHDGLVLDITGSAHLFGGEKAMLDDMRSRLSHAGLSAQIGLGDTRGAAWALAHYGGGMATAGDMASSLAPLPVAALRVSGKTCIALQRLGFNRIGDLLDSPRAPLARRFGPDLLRRMDQALGDQPEEISPQSESPHYGARMTLPEPIGLLDDVMAGTSRLLARICDKLGQNMAGARKFCLTVRRVDSSNMQIELLLARPMQDAMRILALFERNIAKLDAGFGIDQLRLEAVETEALSAQQETFITSHGTGDKDDALDDLISRLGTRVGLENILRFLPADSHIPERSFLVAPAAFSKPEQAWRQARPRPIRLFAPEAVRSRGSQPPHSFHWRGMMLETRRTTGPERIAPEWWLIDETWASGVRDYWRVETAQGNRLWMFYTPQQPGWYVQGEFA